MDSEYRLSSKRVERNVLEEELSKDELSESEEYQRLKREIRELERQVAPDRTS